MTVCYNKYMKEGNLMTVKSVKFTSEKILEIMKDDNLNDSEKMLYLRIFEVSEETGYCGLTNHDLTEIYGVSVMTITNRIKSLKEKGYIEIEVIRKDVPVAIRKIKPIK